MIEVVQNKGESIHLKKTLKIYCFNKHIDISRFPPLPYK